MHFLDPEYNGIYSLIEEYNLNEMISYKHIGSVVKGKEQPVDQESKKWSGSRETYKLIEGDGCITLDVEIDVMEEHLEFMTKMFPKALEKIKRNSI